MTTNIKADVMTSSCVSGSVNSIGISSSINFFSAFDL